MQPAVWSFVLALAAFTGIGVLSATRRRSTTEDYLVAGRAVPAWLAALSAVATNNSGFMFIGLIGFTYRNGLEAIWISGGWVVGDLLAWLFVYRRLRRVSGRTGAKSVPALLGWREGGAARGVVLLTSLLTFVFLGIYAAAQLKAGSAAIESLLGWPPEAGIALGVVIVVAYCFAGGLRASIWTDAAQSGVMLLAMGGLVATATAEVGGPAALVARLAEQDPALARFVPRDLAFGLALYALGFVVGGFGVVGQPHIVIRAMAIESEDQIGRARVFYFLWFVPFTLASYGVGLYARVLMPELGEVAAQAGGAAAELARVHASEQALPELAGRLLPGVFTGIALAGLFAATISTADSQVLACSAAVTQDAFPRWSGSYAASKAATLSVAALALGVALGAGQGVFALVLVAWSALAAALGPLLLLQLAGRPPSLGTASAMAAAGLVAVVAWDASPLSDDVFKLLPGTLAALAVWGGAALVRRRR